MKTEHTPGPWRLQQDGAEPYWSVDMPRSDGVGYGSGNAMVYTTEADARLIAAAPELLEALRYMIANAEADGWSELLIADAIAAVAKAEGRS